MNKLMNSATKLSLTAAFAVLASANAFGQTISDTILYSNTANPTGSVFNVGNGQEVGDQINLSGARQSPDGNHATYDVKSFRFETFGSGLAGSGARATVRFYSADSVTGTSVDAIEFQTAPIAVGDGFQTHTINIPIFQGEYFPIGEEGSFFWTAEFEGIPATGTAGLTLSTPPTVGTSFKDYVEFTTAGDAASVVFKEFTDGSSANFTSSAFGDLIVPEPTALALGLVGGLAFIGMRRRK